MKQFYNSLQLVEKFAFVGLIVGLTAIVILCFVYPRAGISALFMIGTFSTFWAIMTLISASARYISVKKKVENETNRKL
jgi:choline-glycine betaine transporter